MTTIENVQNFQEILLNELGLSKKWINHIIEKWKDEAQNVQSIDDIQDQIGSWKWILSSSKVLWETMRLLEFNPAPSAYLLSIVHISQNENDLMDISFKEREAITQRFRRALQRLYFAGLVDVTTIDPSEVPEGVRTATIYVSPFATEKDIERTKDFYRTRDGQHGVKPRKFNNKTAKEVADHNHKVKAYTVINKYKENAHMYNFYQCPKKHSKGFIRKRKTKRKSKEALKPVKCPECEKILEKIELNEFMELIEKDILKRWGM